MANENETGARSRKCLGMESKLEFGGSAKVLNQFIKLARETGLEPATSAVTGQRSNQLSYSRVDRLQSRSEGGHKGVTN